MRGLRRGASEGLELFAALVLTGVMMVTVVDVMGRYLLNRPLPGSSEITELLMAVLIYAGLPVVSQRNAHIAVDILDPITPKWIVPIRDFVVGILSAFALAVIAWRLWAYAMQIEGAGDVSEYLRLPLYPFAYFMAVLAGLAAIAEVWRTFCRHANSAAASPHTDTV